ncbi:transposase [Streptomyces hirsutus]|uniref:transposase n=1 Tax=Streptomyces hirsutus TaxID=35620 RepID=UPI0036A1D82C
MRRPRWDAVELVWPSGRTVTEVARELGVSPESLRGWVKKARAAQDTGSGLDARGRGGPSVESLSNPERFRCDVHWFSSSEHPRKACLYAAHPGSGLGITTRRASRCP